MRARTWSAACRSVSPSAYCRTETQRQRPRRHGRTHPRVANTSAKDSSANSEPSASRTRTRTAIVPLGNDARTTRAVSSGTPRSPRDSNNTQPHPSIRRTQRSCRPQQVNEAGLRISQRSPRGGVGRRYGPVCGPGDSGRGTRTSAPTRQRFLRAITRCIRLRQATTCRNVTMLRCSGLLEVRAHRKGKTSAHPCYLPDSRPHIMNPPKETEFFTHSHNW